MAAGRLVVCPTPIGNLEDVTLRVLAALREADVVACEDTRRTRTLLDRYGVRAPLVSYHEHNEDRRAGELVERMRGGEVVALVSDAGMPLISDPGFVLVRACVAAGLAVEVLPGPSAALAALVASALPADRWRFVGFLPRRRGELRRVFEEPGGTLVAFESPRRLPGTLAVLADVDPERSVAVCRELTKVHEEVIRGTALELAGRYRGAPPRGEIVLVVGAPATRALQIARLRDKRRRNSDGRVRNPGSRTYRRGMRSIALSLAAAVLLLLASAPPATASRGWQWPVRGQVITPYRNGSDPYAGGQHRGIDIVAPVGTPVVAATAGTVTFAGLVGSSGLAVAVRTADGRLDTSYLHLSSIHVAAGDSVAAGD